MRCLWPNARFQARLKAGARNERTLEAVACKPLLGCWAPTRVPGLPVHRPPPPTHAPSGGPWETAAETATAPGDTPLGAPGPGTTARQPATHRGVPGAARTRHRPRRRPRRPAPNDRPHARQDTPTLLRPRTERHPTTPRPCAQCRGHDAGPKRGRGRQHGRAPDTHPAAAGACGRHAGPVCKRVRTPPPPVRPGLSVGTGASTTAAWGLTCRWAWDGLVGRC